MSDWETTPNIKTRMNAVRLRAPAGPAGLVYEPVETPRLGPGEVLVQVYAAAITRDELDWPVDWLPAVPSYEFSGVVVAVAPQVSDGGSPALEDFAVGDRVYGLSAFDRDGAAAEYIAVQSQFLAPKPRSLSYRESAAIPLAALSAWQGLFIHGGLRAGQRVLIHGAAGGVGSFAVQLAQQCGAYVIGTASSKHAAAVRLLGADAVIDYTTRNFEDMAGQVDLVFDTAGGERLERSHCVVRPGGKIVSVAAQPPKAEAAERGVEAIYFVVEPSREQLTELARLANNFNLRPVIDAVFPISEARQAFERCQGEHGAGKIVLQVVNEQG